MFLLWNELIYLLLMLLLFTVHWSSPLLMRLWQLRQWQVCSSHVTLTLTFLPFFLVPWWSPQWCVCLRWPPFSVGNRSNSMFTVHILKFTHATSHRQLLDSWTTVLPVMVVAAKWTLLVSIRSIGGESNKILSEFTQSTACAKFKRRYSFSRSVSRHTFNWCLVRGDVCVSVFVDLS